MTVERTREENGGRAYPGGAPFFFGTHINQNQLACFCARVGLNRVQLPRLGSKGRSGQRQPQSHQECCPLAVSCKVHLYCIKHAGHFLLTTARLETKIDQTHAVGDSLANV